MIHGPRIDTQTVTPAKAGVHHCLYHHPGAAASGLSVMGSGFSPDDDGVV